MRRTIVLLVLSLCVPPAFAGGTTLTGWLEIIWGDQRPGTKGSPDPIYRLTMSDSRTVQILIDEEVSRAAGGIVNLNGKYVAVDVAPESDILPTSPAPPPVRVLSIRLEQPFGGTQGLVDEITGAQAWVSIMCKFSDVLDEQKNLAYFQNMYASTYPGFDHYWREVSYNLVNVVGSSAAGWFTLPQPRSYYIYDQNGDGTADANLTRLREDCTSVADASVNFANYVGINMMFNADLDCCAWGGGNFITIDGVSKNFRVTWDPPWAFTNAAVLAHEMGHGFGLPHSSGMYGATYDNEWDVMSDTWSNCDRSTHVDYGCLGQHTNSYYKDFLEWIAPAKKFTANGTEQTVTLEQLATPATANYLMVQIPIGGSATHFYVLEARRQVGYDVKLPGQGVIIHEVDTTRSRPAQVVDEDLNEDTGDAGAIFTVGETFTDSVNSISVHIDSATATGFVVTLYSDAATQTTVTSSLNPSLLGTSVTFTATVSNGATGTVTFKDGTTTLGTGTLSGGSTTFTTSALSAGAHAITGVYGGSGSHLASTSAVLTQNVFASALTINNVGVTEGNAGTTNATFTVTLAPTSASTVTVNYATANGTASGGNFASNTSPVVIPSSGNATPYPSTINVAGISGNITKITATLKGFTHTWPNDVDVLLVGPGGQSVVLMSDTGGTSTYAVSGIDVTLDDAAATPLGSTGITTGIYQPTNLEDSSGGDNYGAPAPAAPYGSTMSVFNGTSPNGTWSLYVVDDVGGDSGTLAGGWSLLIATGSADYEAKSGQLTFAPSVATQNITIAVNGDTAAESNETFFVNLSGAVNAAISDNQGQGTINNDDGSVIPTNVVATATTSTNVNVTFTPVGGISAYRVYRSTNGAAYSLVGSPTGSPFSDTTAVANTAYLYKVRSFIGAESGDSNVDLATTVIFTDPTLTAEVTAVSDAHFSQLLTAVNAVRTLAEMATISLTAPTPANGVTIRRQHILDLRTALDAARSDLGLSALTYTDSSLTAQATKVKAAHIQEIRNGVK